MAYLPDSHPILKRVCIMVNTDKMTKELAEALGFSEDEKAALDKAREKTIFFDEDCPEITPEQALKFRRVNPRKGELEKRE